MRISIRGNGIPWYHYYLRQELWTSRWMILYPRSREYNRVLIWGPYEWTAGESITLNDCARLGHWK